jgi:hypothetical protein
MRGERITAGMGNLVRMKTKLSTRVIGSGSRCAALVFSLAVGAASLQAEAVRVFQAAATAETNAHTHIADGTNVIGRATGLNHPAANNNANAVIFLTHNVNPPLGAPNIHEKKGGVLYAGANWQIVHEDGSAFDLGSAFNVKIYPAPIP